jgi:sulfur transfer complex TusBCD TusB component (DsrH family)
MKALNIIESAYRATIEEQDDTIVWLTHAMRGAGAQVDLLLRGNAVNYAVRGQDASGLEFGRWKQTQPPRLEHDLASLIARGATVYALRDDIDDRGLAQAALVEGVKTPQMSALPCLLAGYHRVWHW